MKQLFITLSLLVHILFPAPLSAQQPPQQQPRQHPSADSLHRSSRPSQPDAPHAGKDNRPVQTIRGTVADYLTGTPLPYATIVLADLPHLGATADADGKFTLPRVPVGRHDLQASYLGYEPALISEITLTSAKEPWLDIALQPRAHTLGEIIVKPHPNKEKPLNPMALSGARQLSVEEAGRFAGGMDDPARLVSSLAGVSSGVGNNGISVHGNAPSLLQWRLEDIEIPNPNHFADVATLGGGLLSSLSNNVLGNSDFYTGAFPAEYPNAVSGIFDMKLRNGNNQHYQHTLQAGLLGLDVASEGPFGKKHAASYLFNYRYSTTGLLNKLSPAGELEQAMNYQDLNFKLHFPTRAAGTFSLWGTALADELKPEIQSPGQWDYPDDAKDSRMRQTSAAAGISHRYAFPGSALLKTTLAATYSRTRATEAIYDTTMHASPYLDFRSRYTHLVLTSSLQKKYSPKHLNKTGFTLTRISYDTRFDLAPRYAAPLGRISEGKGNTALLSAYTSSLVRLAPRLSATLGLTGQWLALNHRWTIEPRAALKWQATPKSTFALAYGLHSRMEKMDVYFVKTPATGNRLVNQTLDFTKTHHLSFAYSYRIADDKQLKIEPYFQYLYDVPVVADSSYSILNRSTFYVEDALVNEGKGCHYGVDVTFEKYMTGGFYYLLTASAFNARYRGGDGVWHAARFNRHYIFNALAGKEWATGRHRQNVWSVNLKCTLQGGDRYSPVDEAATRAHPDLETQYDETRAYSRQLPPMCLVHYTLSYRMNRRHVSHEFAVKGLNATGYKEYFGHAYNLKTGAIEPRRLKNSLFNLTYRLDF